MIDAEVSMNIPIKNSAQLTPSRNIPGEVRLALRKSPIASGTPARVIRKLKRPALAMMNMITAGRNHRLLENREEVGELDLFVDQHADDQRVEDRDDGPLRSA